MKTAAHFLIISLWIGFPCIAWCAPETIWSIGRTDGSYKELALAGQFRDYAQRFPEDIHYVVGTSRPEEVWPGVQPGPADDWAGSKPHPYEIHFTLPTVKRGSYLLRLALVNTHGNRPGTLVIEVGSDKRVVRLPTGAGDASLNDPAQGKNYRLDLPLASSLFQSGKNVIRFTTTESWIIWDAIRLEHVDERLEAVVLSDTFDLRVLPLFMERETGLVQLAKLSMTLVKPVAELSLQIRVDGRTQEYSLDGSQLGTIAREMEVPEITKPGEAVVELRDGRKTVFSKILKVKPARKWTIHVVPQAHVDVGYTDLQEKAMEVHRKSNDRAVELIKKYPEFNWSVESSYVLQEWLRTRRPELIEEFVELVSVGRIEIEAFYGNLLTGLLSDEEAFRSLYYSKQLSRDFGSDFLSATLTDAPSHIWSIPTVLRKCGVKYLSMGINQTRGPMLRQGLNKRSPVWWQGQDGSRIIAFFHDHYAWAGKVGLTDAWVGQYETDAGLEKAEEKVPWLLSLYDRPDYPYNSIHLHGAYGDNRPLTEQLPRTVRAWNKKYVYPEIVFSSNSEWFSSIEEKHGEQLATVSGDGGAFWEDGAASSAQQTAINRQNQQHALLAEMLLTGFYAQGKIKDDFRQEFMDIWHLILLYDEHTWGAHNSIANPELPEVKEQFRYKAQFTYQARQRLKPLIEKARSLIEENQVRPSHQWKFADTTLRTPFYILTFDVEKGGIKSIVDIETNQELIDSSAPYLCGQIIYARNEKPPYELTTSTFESISADDQSVVLRLKHPQMPKINLVIRPGVDSKRLDFRYEIEKIETYEKEAVYIAFPFVGIQPEIDYAVANAVVRAGRDWLPGACKDWFTVQNWVRVHNSHSDVAWASLDSPLINLQDINSNKWLDELPINNGHIYAYVMNNYWFTNYKASQGGKFDFRFALTSDPSIPNSKVSKFGRDWSAAERLAIGKLVSAAPDNVIVSAFKRSEDGKGYIARLREMSGKTTKATLHVPSLAGARHAFLATGVEDVLEELSLQNNAVVVDLKPWEIVTVRIQ
jgi:hypothetical protein